MNAPAKSRFYWRWVNGHWVVFDKHEFKPVRCAGTRKEIVRIFNTGK